MRMIGPYEIRGELGRGAMAVVWRGWDPKLEREVAIKVPVLPHGVGPEMAAELGGRFVREGRAAARLAHPGIVTVFAADNYDGQPAIVMELIDGDTLTELLKHGPLPATAVRNILDQLLDAAGYAHERGVIHRDLKPDNVFVTTDGRVKITDFGIAHVAASSTLTQAGTMMGTPGYMSPEQIRGEQVDARTDLFAIGVIGYELLTGVNPFIAGDAHPTTVMYRVLNEPLPDLEELYDLDVDVAAAIDMATTKEPDDRFANAEQFQKGLRGEEFSLQPRTTVSSSEPTSRLVSTAGRTEVPGTCASCGKSVMPRDSLLVDGAVVCGECASVSLSKAQAPVSAPSGRPRRSLLAIVLIALAVLASVALWFAVRPRPAADTRASGAVPGPSSAANWAPFSAYIPAWAEPGSRGVGTPVGAVSNNISGGGVESAAVLRDGNLEEVCALAGDAAADRTWNKEYPHAKPADMARSRAEAAGRAREVVQYLSTQPNVNGVMVVRWCDGEIHWRVVALIGERKQWYLFGQIPGK